MVLSLHADDILPPSNDTELMSKTKLCLQRKFIKKIREVFYLVVIRSKGSLLGSRKYIIIIHKRICDENCKVLSTLVFKGVYLRKTQIPKDQQKIKKFQTLEQLEV